MSRAFLHHFIKAKSTELQGTYPETSEVQIHFRTGIMDDQICHAPADSDSWPYSGLTVQVQPIWQFVCPSVSSQLQNCIHGAFCIGTLQIEVDLQLQSYNLPYDSFCKAGWLLPEQADECLYETIFVSSHFWHP